MDEKATMARVAAVLDRIGEVLFPRGTVKDSVSWDDGSCGWIMNAKRLGKIVGGDGFMRLTAEHVHDVLRSIGLKDGVFEYESGWMHVSTFLDHMNEVVNASSGGCKRLTFIPEPGYPWPEPYYSQKAGQMVQGNRPWWLVNDLLGNLDYDVVDFCKLMPPLREHGVGAEVLKLGREQIVLTHAMGTMADLTRLGSWDKNAKSVNDCGGLLFPSLAIGVPATNFGPFVLVADVGLLKHSLKQGRGRVEDAPAQIFDTDVWTINREIVSIAGKSAFKQLTGASDWVYNIDVSVWPLGLDRQPEIYGPGVGNRLERMAQLKREVVERRRLWPRSMSPEEQLDVYENFLGKREQYPYLEAKVNGVMPMSLFPMAVQPEQASDGFARFLDATGFRGALLSVELPEEVADAMSDKWPDSVDWKTRSMLKSWSERQYAWHVQDAILEHGSEIG